MTENEGEFQKNYNSQCLAYKSLHSSYRDNSQFSSEQSYLVLNNLMRSVRQCSYTRERVPPRNNMALLKGC